MYHNCYEMLPIRQGTEVYDRNYGIPSLIPRPHPDFISQLWTRLRDKIWVGPGDEAMAYPSLAGPALLQ